MATLLSCQPPPPSGYVTVLEHECQFISRPAEEEEGESLGQSGRERGAPSISLQASQGLLAVAGVKVAFRLAVWRMFKGKSSRIVVLYLNLLCNILLIAYINEEEC